MDRIRALGQGLRDRLADLPNVTVPGVGAVRCAIVSLACHRLEAPRCTAPAFRPDQCLGLTPPFTRIDIEDRDLAEVVRASVHYDNSEGELDLFTERLAQMS